MIVELIVENFRSFRDEAVFSSLATRERNHRESLSVLPPKYRASINPVSAIYGGNASGKTAFLESVRHLQGLVLGHRRGGVPLPYQPFRLDPKADRKNTSFEILFLEDEQLYRYSIKSGSREIIQESLSLVLSTREQEVFHRSDEGVEFPEREPIESVRSVVDKIPKNISLINYLVDSLGNFDDWVIDCARAFYVWLNRVRIVSPDDLMDNAVALLGQEKYSHIWDDVIEPFDTGVDGVHRVRVDPDLIFPSDMPFVAEPRLLEGGGVVTLPFRDSLYSFEYDDSEESLVVHRLSLQHAAEEGSLPFEWAAESDGTKQMFRLIPFFMSLASGGNSVVLIDELDRSLHTNIAIQLIKWVLSEVGPESRSQLLFTTHDLMLMDIDLLRRDQLWLVEKSRQGVSSLIPVAQYEGIRKDSDLRKSYLQGRFGGVPSPRYPVLRKPSGTSDIENG